MSSENNKEVVKALLDSSDGVVLEETLQNLFSSEEAFNSTMQGIAPKLAELGFELIRTTFEGRRVYILGSQSNKMPVSDELLGVLIFTTAYLKENGETVPVDQFEELFAEVLPEIEELCTQGYLVKKEEQYVLHPRTKVLLKNIYKGLDFQKLL